jgi:hypothetical protein
MRRSPVRLPILLAAAAALLGAVSTWQMVRFASANALLRQELSDRRAHATAANMPSNNESSAELNAINSELERERARLREAESKAEKLAQSLAITPAEELKSFGRVEELAIGGANFLKAIQELPKAKQAAELEGRQWDSAVFMKDLPGWIVSMEAIGKLEENPKEIAELHARALREMLGFDEGTSRRVCERLTAEFESLGQQGLIRAHRPSEGQEEWYARRDRMVLEAAARIEALISPKYQKPNAVAEAMNLGTAFRNRLMHIAGVRAGGMELYYQEPGSEPIAF